MQSFAKGRWLAGLFIAYTLGVLVLASWLASHPLQERRLFLREPGLHYLGESPAEREAALELALQQPADMDFVDYHDRFLSRLDLVALDGSIRVGPDQVIDYHQLPDFGAIEHIPTRKQAFFDYLRPAVEYQNQLIRERRLILKGIEIRLAQGAPLTPTQERYMGLVRERYRIDAQLSDAEALALLIRRMDTIPVSMVLAQAALESAWGQSRFAREGNNLFGQWCFSKGCGMVPAARVEGASHEVARFDSINEAVAAYFENINAFHRYSGIRDIREAARQAGRPLRGYDMVAGLESYSSRGADYIRELRHLIRSNKLE